MRAAELGMCLSMLRRLLLEQAIACAKVQGCHFSTSVSTILQACSGLFYFCQGASLGCMAPFVEWHMAVDTGFEAQVNVDQRSSASHLDA